MKAHRKLLEHLIYGARIARINAPFGHVGRVRMDLSVEEVDELAKEARESAKHVRELERQLNVFQSSVDTLDGPLIKHFRDD